MAGQRNDDFDVSQFVAEIPYEEIDHKDRKEKVGSGSFGTVHRARWRNIDVAVKMIELESNFTFIREVRQMARVSHKNIVRLYGACTKRPNVCLVMEYCEYSLYKILHVQRHIQYSAGHAISWALQCAEGVAYLHAMTPKPLIHRDLKPPNLLLRECGTVLKICDFGTVADKATQMTNNRGSAAWMAPEVFKTSNYTEKCDVYSWSLILWEMLSRKQPFNELGNVCSIMWYVHEGNRPPLLDGCPKCLQTIMEKCWDQEPTNRPAMATVVDLMTKLLPLFPGGDQPLNFEIPSNRSSDDYEDSTLDEPYSNTVGETTYTSKMYKDPRNATSSEPQEYWTRDFDRKIRERPQLSDRMNGLLNNSNRVALTPLQVDVDKNAWALPEYTTEDESTAHAKGPYPANSQGNERLTITKRSGSSESTITTTNTSDNSSESSFDKNSIKYMLDPHLRPIDPDPTSRISKEIYADHIRKAEEYLKVQTELAYTQQRKDEILAQMTPEEREKKLIFLQRLKEKEEIIKIRDAMLRQCEALNLHRPQQQQQGTPDMPAEEVEEGFILIPKK
ncbi:mitogen-activated protein kinase kinase kinase 7 [Culicoides brevitarsis]|uniref:mitogen-activated protein kinase kinase kinase 7 n=1 Tax=Culicoides brevitarsis TaxID=469753 RepID=UPI00307C8854